MATLDVAFTPAQMVPADVAIVVDALRATSTITQALDSGYYAVHCCETIAVARAQRLPGRILAGECHCVRVDDFELGNSPEALAAGPLLGNELVLATTNGSPAIVLASRHAPRVLIGCLLNLAAVIAAIPTGARVLVVCSGTDGRFALEDAYVAGRIVIGLGGARSDAALAAECVACSYGSALQPFAQSADGRLLEATGQGRDIAWCARESVLALVPEVRQVNGATVTVMA